MAGRISRGWGLLKESWGVLRQDKELMLFPVVSSFACLGVLASFVLPVIFVPELRQTFEAMRDGEEAGWQNIAAYALLLAYYIANYFVIVFFNTALVSCALIRFRGGNPTVGDGLRAAFSRLPQIFAWAVVAATVGMLLRALEERLSFLGKIVIGLIGIAWTIACYFVVPVLAAERLGPFAAVGRSAALLRKTWGESLVGHVSLSAISLILALPAIVLIGAGVAGAVAAESIWLAVGALAVAVLYLVILAIITSTLQQVFLAGVYLYAAEGTVPQGFSEESLQSAFRPKGQ